MNETTQRSNSSQASLLAALLAIAGPSATGQVLTDTLLKDIHVGPSQADEASSGPNQFVTSNGIV